MPRKPRKSNTGRQRYLNVALTEDQHCKLVDLAYHKNKTIKELVWEVVEKCLSENML